MKSHSTSIRRRLPDAIPLYGAESLSDAQIIAMFLDFPAVKVGERILHKVGNLAYLLFAGHAQLRSVGMNDREAARFEVVLEFYQRVLKSGDQRPQPLSPALAAVFLRPRTLGWIEERFGILALNGRGEVLADRVLAQGSPVHAVVSPSTFYREALRFGAVRALAWHNHPDGNPAPTAQDQALTRRLRKAGELIGVPLADHIIVTRDSYFSFREQEAWKD